MGMADSTYDVMISRKMGESGFLEIPFKQYFSYTDTHTGSSRFTISTQSLDRIWVVQRPAGYDSQGAPIRVKGYKTSGAFTSPATIAATQTAGAVTNDIGQPEYDGGLSDTNKELYNGKYFNFSETPANDDIEPQYQIQINGAYINQYRGTAKDWYTISKNSLPAYKGCAKNITLDQYLNNYFVQCVRLNIPDSELGREITGLNSKGVNLQCYYNSTGVSQDVNIVIFCECTSTLRIGAGRQLEILQ